MKKDIPDVLLPADHPRRSLHHTTTYRTEAEWEEEMFGKGPFDPDRIGHYPGEVNDPTGK